MMDQQKISGLVRALLDTIAAHETARGDTPSPTWDAVKVAANEVADAVDDPEDGGDFTVSSDGPVLN